MIDRLLSQNCKNERGFTSIGVNNVERRIKLNYGEGYGICVDSVIGEYTNVKLLIPKIKSEREIVDNV